MKVKCYQLSSVGAVREHNEDFIAFWEPEDFYVRKDLGSIAILADGVGGMGHGEVASRLAAESALASPVNPSPTRWEVEPRVPEAHLMPAIMRFLGYDPQPPAQTFPEMLYRSRRALGFTQPKAAEAFGVPLPTFRAWEEGHYEPKAGRKRLIETRVEALLAVSKRSGTKDIQATYHRPPRVRRS